MKRRSLLITACIFAVASLGLNIWLLLLRDKRPGEPGPATPGHSSDAAPVSVLQPVTMDFSDTAFADGSWKLTDETDPAVSLDKPFTWEDLPPPGRQSASLVPPLKTNVTGRGPVEHVPYDVAEPAAIPRPSPKLHPLPIDLRATREREGPHDSETLIFDPNDVRSKALLVSPPQR